MPLPSHSRKIVEFIKKIEDPSLMNIIAEVIHLEYANRGSHRFPVQKVIDAVDAEATLIERDNEKGKNK
jgi:hypothetical protein